MKYKLKPEARQFFDNITAREVMELSKWNGRNIPIQLLDEVEKVHIEYGKITSPNCKNLSGWKGMEQEAHFEFTVRAYDMSNEDYERITGKSIPEVMDEIQKVLNKYFKR